ncbi:MAG: dihydroorotate dehydrogenase electron transfer subunit [Atopobium sp.]|uniref:dihydroorotate dehydrogenase electron transfer subunit n=1 Tax=Atopobium sp. TaxID=1872650 RepID=UPI002A751E14|nr:dihydroorotate dehydrogenase electron transfer subunit [Atopobium sp.]MDY2787884.1 dihydroorotate dehydrogenase electron transfer subunit [Atopobium sp.]MDY4522531.1 dihydroorotate dehydrogenase electron transfer subunit [Atopobium sp.]
MRARSRTQLHEFIVVENAPVAAGLHRIVIKADKLAHTIIPGQFVNIAVPGDPSHIVRIPLSYSASDPQAGTIEIVYALVGEGTRRLASMKPGDGSNLVGASGNGWQIHDDDTRVLLVAGGVGVTPLIGLARELADSNTVFDMVIGAQTKDRLWGSDQAHAAGAAQVVITTDDGSCGLKGFTTDGMKQLLATHSYDRVFTCGPQIMMKGIAQVALEHAIPCEVSLERMMTCGFGACHVCNVAMVGGSYKRCCTEGPVFDATEVVW